MATARQPDERRWIWPFSRADLTAGLRRFLGRPGLRVGDVQPLTVVYRRPAIGRIRGLRVEYVTPESGSIQLVVKETRGTTRTGTAGAGLREVGVYRSLAGQVPLSVPRLVAASPTGDWILLEEIRPARDAAHWTREDYRVAVDALTILHDRFWGLAEDLGAYPWLARPLEEDFSIHLAVAGQSIERMARLGPAESLPGAAERIRLLQRLTERAAQIAEPLRRESSTLLHGDYWPGNLAALADGSQVVYDWQLAGVGPGVIDLLVFITKSEWWFGDRPMSRPEMVRIYREGMERRHQVSWSDEAWDELWDHALMWRFLQEWVDLLAASPPTLWEVQAEQLDQVWLRPVAAAVERRLGLSG